jgi:hypothetical protein
MHLSAEGQEAPQTYPAPDGTLALCQVVPLLVVKMMAAAALLCSPPRAMQGPEAAHVTPDSCVTDEGTLERCQVAPPSFVVIAMTQNDPPSPTAMHASADEHAIPARFHVPAGTGR